MECAWIHQRSAKQQKLKLIKRTLTFLYGYSQAVFEHSTAGILRHLDLEDGSEASRDREMLDVHNFGKS